MLYRLRCPNCQAENPASPKPFWLGSWYCQDCNASGDRGKDVVVMAFPFPGVELRYAFPWDRPVLRIAPWDGYS